MAKQKRIRHKADVAKLHGVKNGSIKRNKNLKFKNIPSGDKVALINNSKVKNKNASPQKKFQKGVDMKNNQNSPKGSAKQSKKKQNSSKGKQNSSHGAQKKLVNKKFNLNIEKKLEKVNNSDVNEEILSQKDVNPTKMDVMLESEEGSSDTSVQDLFGMSLNDESDEDDEDFVEEEGEEDDDDDDEDEDEYEEDDDDDNDDDEDDDDDDDDDDNSNIEEETRPSKYFQGIKPNVEINDEEDEIDEDNVEEDENFLDGDFNKISSLLAMETDINNEDEDENDVNEDDDEDEDDYDDDDDADDVDEDENSVLGLKALLANNIADDDDDDDEDFNEEDEDDEDDDISDEDEDSEENDPAVNVMEDKATNASNSKYDSKENRQIEEEEESKIYSASDFTEDGDYTPDLEINKRTIRVDNVPKETKESVIRKVFGKFGTIDTIRIRGIIPKNPKMSKKVAAITKQIHPKINTFIVYVKYKLKQSARNALSINGKLFEGNFVNVKILHDQTRRIYDNKKAVFLGNLKFGIDNNKIFKHFGQCGEIENIRLVRDQQTGITKGFGYINFKTEEGAALALQLDGKIIMKRPVRVRPCVSSETQLERRLKREEARKRAVLNADGSAPKKLKTDLEKSIASEIENEGNVKKHKKKSNPFQGQQAGFKNKTKDISYHKMKKKEMARKLVAKPNKPAKV